MDIVIDRHCTDVAGGHDKTMTKSKWSPDEFRNKKYAKGWRETDGEIEGWGNIRDRMADIQIG